jgi:hypothetical protein
MTAFGVVDFLVGLELKGLVFTHGAAEVAQAQGVAGFVQGMPQGDGWRLSGVHRIFNLEQPVSFCPSRRLMV